MAKKYVSTKKYNYDEGSKKKKIILIVVAVLLAVVVAVAATVLMLLGGGDKAPGEPTFTVHAMPEKTTYYVGDVPAWSGLKLKLTTAEGNVVILKPDNCKISGFDSSAPVASQVITVTYKEYSTTFSISILDKSELKPENLFVGMTFKSKPKTQYKVGENLSVEGGVLLKTYQDGSTEEMALTSDMVFDFTTAAAGKYTVKVMYVEDALRATLTYDITVSN